MLNSKGERELAYLVLIKDIKPLEGYDRVELAYVNGWTTIVPKGRFRVGDVGIYFEVDSLVPAEKPFEFMATRKYRVKTIHMCNVYSSGILMSEEDFAGTRFEKAVRRATLCGDEQFLTDALGIKHYERWKKEDLDSPYLNRARTLHPKIMSSKIVKRLLKYPFTRKIILGIFGRKRRNKNITFPSQYQYVKRTDEERIENLPYILDHDEVWVKTAKLDGTSATYLLARKPFGKTEFYVCTRDRRLFSENDECFLGINVYWEMAKKYMIREKMELLLETNKKYRYVCLQGEIVGPRVQGNPHGLKERDLYIFNFITSEEGRWDSLEARNAVEAMGLKFVPIINRASPLPKTMEEMKLSADGPCELPGSVGLGEGHVYRSRDGSISFKNVSRMYIMQRQGEDGYERRTCNDASSID